MKRIKIINISNISIDNYPLNTSTFNLSIHINQGGSIPPIKVKILNGLYIIKDGRHRVTACKLLGIKKIKAIVCKERI